MLTPILNRLGLASLCALGLQGANGPRSYPSENPVVPATRAESSWTLPMKVDGDPRADIQVQGLKAWYLIGNSTTPGQNTIALSVTATSTITMAEAQIDSLPRVQLNSVSGGFSGSLNITNLAAGTHSLTIYTNGSSTVAYTGSFKRSHPIYVLLTTDWDTSDSPDAALAMEDAYHANHPSLKITHFVGPYTFTDPALSASRRAYLVNRLKNLKTSGDEIGLHIHPYQNFVAAAGVTFKSTPSYAYSYGDTTGYTVYCTAYSEAEFLKLVQTADTLFVNNGLGKPTSYRAGGWTAGAAANRALSASGYVAETSGANWARLEEWQTMGNSGTYNLFNWMKQTWPSINDVSQPYHPSETNPATPGNPGLPLLEIPDNGALADYVTGAEMIQIFTNNFNGTPLQTPTTLVIGYHPASLSTTFDARIKQALTHIDQYLANQNAGPVVYETLSRIAPLWTISELSWVQQPVNQTVAAGETATFTAEATGNPAANYQWQVSTNGGTSWNNVTTGTGATTMTYTTAPLSVANNGNQFRAVASNAYDTIYSQAATVTVPTVNPSQVANDFTGDGKSDLLWRHSTNGTVYIMPINGTAVLPGAVIHTEPDPVWVIVGTGDFDGDAKADILWWNSTTGQLCQFLMNGTTIKTTALIYTEPNTAWQPVDIGDYDGDGKSDITFFNNSTGQVFQLQMNGTAVKSGTLVHTATSGWKIQ